MSADRDIPLSIQMRDWDRLNRPSDARSYVSAVAELERQRDNWIDQSGHWESETMQLRTQLRDCRDSSNRLRIAELEADLKNSQAVSNALLTKDLDSSAVARAENDRLRKVLAEIGPIHTQVVNKLTTENALLRKVIEELPHTPTCASNWPICSDPAHGTKPCNCVKRTTLADFWR